MTPPRLAGGGPYTDKVPGTAFVPLTYCESMRFLQKKQVPHPSPKKKNLGISQNSQNITVMPMMRLEDADYSKVTGQNVPDSRPFLLGGVRPNTAGWYTQM